MADSKVVEQEFVVRVPQREENKKYHVIKFRASGLQQVDGLQDGEGEQPEDRPVQRAPGRRSQVWRRLRLRSGHEGGTEAEKAWRKNYDPNAQPWLILYKCPQCLSREKYQDEKCRTDALHRRTSSEANIGKVIFSAQS